MILYDGTRSEICNEVQIVVLMSLWNESLSIRSEYFLGRNCLEDALFEEHHPHSILQLFQEFLFPNPHLFVDVPYSCPIRIQLPVAPNKNSKNRDRLYF